MSFSFLFCRKFTYWLSATAYFCHRRQNFTGMPPAAHFFLQQKSGQKRRQKPMVFGFPLRGYAAVEMFIFLFRELIRIFYRWCKYDRHCNLLLPQSVER